MTKIASAPAQIVQRTAPSRQIPGPMLVRVSNPRLKRWRHRLVRMGLVLGVVAALILAHKPVLMAYAHAFRVDNPAPSDAIVVLLGGADHRPIRAVELYHQGIAPLILLGTSATDPTTIWRETQMNVDEMVQRGIPRSAIQVLPGTVTSTREEAAAVREYAKSHAIHRITLVTTAFHSARARWIFRKELKGLGIDIRAASAEHAEYNESNWYKSDEGMVQYFSETLKTLYYRLRY